MYIYEYEYECIRPTLGIRRDASALKSTRMKRIHSMLKGAGDVDYDRFVATVEYQIGLNPATVKRYLRTLETLDFIEIDETLGIVRERDILKGVETE